MDDIFTKIIAYLVFLLSTTVHEASHALAAKLGGDLTAYRSGQVSLDPMPHIRREPLGMVVFPIIFIMINGWPFGWASAPYNPFWERLNPRKAALMGLAGPAANLFIVIIAGLILKIGLMQGFFSHYEVQNSLGYIFIRDGGELGESSLAGVIRMLCIFFDINLVLFLLNLFPLPGLDGSSIITLLLPRNLINGYLDFINNPPLLFLSLLVVWKIFPNVFWPFYVIARALVI
jgi:Zn-dependent protease